MLAAICTTAQEHTLAWRNLGIKVNYATSFSFSRDQLPTTLDWNKPNYSTFRLGLSYDWQREQA